MEDVCKKYCWSEEKKKMNVIDLVPLLETKMWYCFAKKYLSYLFLSAYYIKGIMRKKGFKTYIYTAKTNEMIAYYTG